MANLPGVRVGPLDPDRAENFGQVAGGTTSARQLIRHHVAMHPPALVAALGRTRQAERSDAIDRAEAEEAIRAHYEEEGEGLPEGTRISGMSVRGEDDGDQQVLTFSYILPSGRSGKGFIPYDDEHVSGSIESGDDAVRIAKLKEAGLPWEPRAVAQREGREFAGRDETARLRRENEELRDRLREVEQQRAPIASTAGGGSGVAASPQTPEGGSASTPGSRGPAEAPERQGRDPQEADGGGTPAAGAPAAEQPWPGYDDERADDIRRRVREANDREMAERVLAYEQSQSGAGRSTVVAAANEVIDRKA